MRQSNVHLLYACGILLALFIGSLSVQWNNVKDLAGLISFAVGISSLILAIIAIFQSLTSGQSASNTLSALEQSSRTMLNVSNDFLPKIDQILREHREGREEITQLKTLVSTSNIRNVTTSIDKVGNIEAGGLTSSITNGATLPLLCATWSEEFSREFSTNVLTGNNLYQIGYFEGVLAGGVASALFKMQFNNGLFSISGFRGNLAQSEAYLVALSKNLAGNKEHLQILKNMLTFFPEKRSLYTDMFNEMS